MKTRYTIIPTSCVLQVQEINMPKEPSIQELDDIIRPVIGINNHWEHVTVLHEDQYTDMFVDEMGAVLRLPANRLATDIYRHNFLSHHPHTSPKLMPQIFGDVVLFHRKVWF